MRIMLNVKYGSERYCYCRLLWQISSNFSVWLLGVDQASELGAYNTYLACKILRLANRFCVVNSKDIRQLLSMNERVAPQVHEAVCGSVQSKKILEPFVNQES